MRKFHPRVAARFALAATLFSLAGCGGDVERTFGLVRDTPDEFTVTTRAPLSMPPDFALTPPEPGAPRPQELTSQQAAEAALAPDTALGGTAGPDSAGQQALVAQAGPEAPSDIRSKIDSEVQLDHPPRSLADQLMFWKSAPPAGTLLDPAAESQRLREDAALGQPATEGQTAIIQTNPKPKFLGLF